MNQAYQLICCDLDGTLLNEKDEVSEKNKEMIQRCRKQGMQFAIVSGRPVEGILQLIKQWQMEEMVDYVIGMNGGVVYHCKTAIKKEYHRLDGAIIKAIMEHYAGWKVRFIIFDGAKRYVSYSDEETNRLAASYCEQEVQTDMFTLCDVPRNKLIVQCYPQDMPKVEAHGKQYHNAQCVCFKTAADLFEFVNPQVNKSSGIQKLCEDIGITMQEVLAFGDTSNDNEMLRDAGLGVWLCNGSEDTKAMADAVAKANTESGVGCFLEEYIL